MTREEIISGLKFTVEMFLFDPSTGEKYIEPRNDMDKTTIDACRGAIKLLEQEPVLDKIIAEIEEYRSRQLTLAIGVKDLEEGKQTAIEYILAIIDKYQTESVR